MSVPPQEPRPDPDAQGVGDVGGAAHRIAIAEALERLWWPLRLTWAGMLAERFARAFWPFWTVAIAAVALAALDVPAALSPAAAATMLVVFAAALVASLGFGLWRFRWPMRAEAFDRLDRTLPGRPLSALADVQAVGAGDAASAAVWRAHLERMANRAAQARAAPADLRLAARDPYAMRYVGLTLLAVALLFGSFARVADVAEMAPAVLTGEAGAAVPTTSWEAWVQPPAYTGRPSLYLNEVDRPALEIPEGSRVTVRLYGETGVLSLAETVSGEAVEDPAAPAHQFEVERSGRISVQGPGGRGWEITARPDAPPSIRLAGPMTREARGRLGQPFEARDDYGVVSGEAVIELDLDAVERRHGLVAAPEPRDPIVLDLPMPIAGDRTAFEEVLIEDLSQHPWANLPVRVQLSATDARGQTSRSRAEATDLPGRRFFDPLASAVIELRRDLLWSASNAPRVVRLMRALSHRPEGFFRNERAFLAFRVALRQLEAGMADAAPALAPDLRDEVAAALWEVALLIEEGDLADAAERLRRAQDRLAEAMRSGADPSEIEALMQELREAMQEYMRRLAEQGAEDSDGDRMAGGERMEVTGDQLQQLMDRIQELMEQGRMAEAMELLEQLNRLMENLQVTMGEGGEGMPGQQAMEGMGEALRDQQGLSDDTFRDLQERFDNGRPMDRPGTRPGDDLAEGEGQGEGDEDRGEGEGQGADGRPGPGDLAQRQRDLRERLRDLDRFDMPREGGEQARDALDEAARAMEEAEQALREGDGAGALDRQAEAIEALREGMRGLGEAMAEAERERRGEDSATTGQGGTDARRDPLGRDTGALGRLGTEDELLQGDDVYRRARDILDEIRRRSGEQDRPEIELDYLRRLLDRF